MREKPIWWRIVLGSLLIYLETKQLLFPGARALQPSNSTQATTMLVVEGTLLLVGLWLVISGIKAKDKKPPTPPV